jgi:hypothetical protein
VWENPFCGQLSIFLLTFRSESINVSGADVLLELKKGLDVSCETQIKEHRVTWVSFPPQDFTMLIPTTKELLVYLLVNGRQPLWLPDIDLLEAVLAEADLTSANLKGARLEGADLQEAVLTKAKLNVANLRRSKLMKADLTGADLTKAVLEDADLTDAKLDTATLTGATYTSRTVWPSGFDPIAAGAVEVKTV